ncbi:hypothetical protein CAEBREN_01667 [Caenorhabditis brenneri]|uniref:Lipoprotein n=1 Tax=Caenorhabditis brenneri TaxID=135651 RepID=G0N0Q0_CAEBE|nr:hypothetical protein CAEBREN_01667 [Caenorhabditis brenneri]
MIEKLMCLVLLAAYISGCEIEFDYDYETVPPFLSDCSECPPFTSLFYPHYANVTDTDKFTEISECVYNYTCTTILKGENYVIVNATADITYPTGNFLRVQLTDKASPQLGDPINVFDALGIRCLQGLWYATKFPFGLAHNAGNRTITPQAMAGIKLPLQKMSILCN